MLYLPKEKYSVCVQIICDHMMESVFYKVLFVEGRRYLLVGQPFLQTTRCLERVQSAVMIITW